MVLCTTQGYILDIWGGCGGGGKFRDVKIWKNIISEAINILAALPKRSEIVVDRGFRGEVCFHQHVLSFGINLIPRGVDKEGALEKHFTLPAPIGNKKGRKGNFLPGSISIVGKIGFV